MAKGEGARPLSREAAHTAIAREQLAGAILAARDVFGVPVLSCRGAEEVARAIELLIDAKMAQCQMQFVEAVEAYARGIQRDVG